MRRPGRLGTGWPDEVDLSLVRAALGPPDRTLSEWERFTGAVSLADDHVPERHRLLSAVWGQLHHGAPGHRDLPVLKGISRRTWVNNQRALSTLARAVEALGSGSRPWALAPHAQLALGDDLGWLPSDPLTLLVPAVEVDPVTAALVGAGWSTTRGRGAPWVRPRVVRDPAGGELRLLSRAGVWLVEPDEPHRSLDPLLEAARPATVGQATVPVLDPADALVALCSEGPTPGSPVPLRWMVLVAALVGGTDLTPERVAATSRRFRIEPLVRGALEFLSEVVDVGDADQLRALVPEGGTVGHRQLDRALVARRGPAAGLRAEWVRNRRSWSGREAVTRLPGFLTSRWGLDSAWQLPGAVAGRVTATVGRKPFRG
ncbi:MAG: hypothetical protein U5K29_02355 [Acidimicrobiales bacterium]|nr:hypothetical protein [Acidimicrobiales bacterium]